MTQEFINELEAEMLQAAEQLEFERAAALRDRILQLKKQLGQPLKPEEEAAASEANQRGQKGKQRGRKRGASRGGDSRIPKPER